MHIIFLHCWHTGVIAAPLPPPSSPSCISLLLYKQEGRRGGKSQQNKCCNHSSYFSTQLCFIFHHLRGRGGCWRLFVTSIVWVHCCCCCWLGCLGYLSIFLHLFYIAQDKGVSLMHKLHWCVSAFFFFQGRSKGLFYCLINSLRLRNAL